MKSFIKCIIFIFLLIRISGPGFCESFQANPQPVISNLNSGSNVQQRIETKIEDIPHFANPVVLLVGLDNKELTYREFSNLSGYDFFTVPYGTDTTNLVEQVKPNQVIVKHPSGFVGLYSPSGQLIRGVETISGNEEIAINGVPESIVKPGDSVPFDMINYPGAFTGSVPQGGLGYVPPPTNPTLKRHILKTVSYGAIGSFQYPGFFKGLDPFDSTTSLLPSLIFPLAPNLISTVASYVDSKLDQQEYARVRTQPRDYKYQPEVEGY